MLKIFLVSILVIGIIGYLWYSGALTFDAQNIPEGMIKTSEKAKELTKTISNSNEKTVFYSIQEIPNIPDKQIPQNALKKALSAWESLNPNLKFVESSSPDVQIRWQSHASETHSGLATCNSALFGVLNHCYLDISVGNEDCNGNYVQNDENMVANIIMHEMGHALGLKHTSERNNLMYSTESPIEDFNNYGLTIPEKFEELYVGQKSLLEEDKQLREEIGLLETKIAREQSQYDEYYKIYEYYKGKTLAPDEFQKAQRMLDQLNSQGEKVNSMIDQRNDLVLQSNEILEKLGCQPNFVIQRP